MKPSSILAGLTHPSTDIKAPVNPGAAEDMSKHSPVAMHNRVRMNVVGPDGAIKKDTGWMYGNIVNTFGLASLASMVGSGGGVNASTLVSVMSIGTGTTAET